MLVGNKNCILKKHSGGEVGAAEFRESEKRVWGLSLLWWSGLVGNLALLLPPLSDTLAPGIEGSPVFLFRHAFKTWFLPQPFLSLLLACQPPFSHITLETLPIMLDSNFKCSCCPNPTRHEVELKQPSVCLELSSEGVKITLRLLFLPTSMFTPNSSPLQITSHTQGAVEPVR